MLHQRVPWYACPIPFGCKDNVDAWFEKAERARSVQPFPFAVAPRVCLKLPTGRTLLQGEQVREEDFVGDRRAPSALLREALRDGRVLARDDALLP
jgi:hypothetical protein